MNYDPFTLAYNASLLFANLRTQRKLWKCEALAHAAACNVLNSYFLSVEQEMATKRELDYVNMGDVYRQKQEQEPESCV